MRTFSVRQLVVYLPIAVVVMLCGFTLARRVYLHGAISRYSAERRESGTAHLGNIEGVVGIAKTKRAMTEISRTDTEVLFDGEARYAQLIRPEAQIGERHGIAMYTLGPHRTTQYVYLPAGTRIVDGNFDRDSLVIRWAGKPKSNDRQIAIREAEPQKFSIPWPKSDPPQFVNLSDLMLIDSGKGAGQNVELKTKR
ncbi:hypothetical protein [Rhodopirellula bahusiensis]|uniref:hypothetical protein n=1 Tax=Rhodopirellula bahusiensis TaxID=2014065 RepID=UPI003264B0B5